MITVMKLKMKDCKHCGSKGTISPNDVTRHCFVCGQDNR